MKDKISVIVSVYNVGEHIERCIESLLSQNYKNYEIILVDDGSTDKSAMICERYFRENPTKIRLIRQDNGGLSAARNTGLSVASGEFVTFVDGDDYLEKNALSTLSLGIKRERADIAVAGFFEDFPDFSKEISQRRGLMDFDKIMECMSGRDGYKLVVVWGKLYRRSLFCGVEFPVGRIHEDQYIIHKLYYYSKKTVAVDGRVYHHINRAGSISSSADFTSHMDDVEALFLRAKFLSEKGRGACNVYVARHMLYLLKYYLKSAPRKQYNSEKCRYIKRVMRFVHDNLGRSSEMYQRCRALYFGHYFKYKLLACIYG